MSEKKITTLEQMKEAALRNIRAIGECARVAAESIQEIDSLKTDKGKAVQFSIPVSGWKSGSGISDYPFYYDVLIEGVTVNDRVTITIEPGSIRKAARCGLCPTNESSEGKVRIYSSGIPQESIAAEYWVETGRE